MWGEVPGKRYKWGTSGVPLDLRQSPSRPLSGGACRPLPPIPLSPRWCLTGTPISRGLEDLFGLFAFLRAGPWDKRAWWNRCVEGVGGGVDSVGLCGWPLVPAHRPLRMSPPVNAFPLHVHMAPSPPPPIHTCPSAHTYIALPFHTSLQCGGRACQGGPAWNPAEPAEACTGRHHVAYR